MKAVEVVLRVGSSRILILVKAVEVVPDTHLYILTNILIAHHLPTQEAQQRQAQV